MTLATVSLATLPATRPEMLDALEELEAQLRGHEPCELPTEHVIHGGMYARTVRMPPGLVLVGVVVKRPTLVVACGTGAVLRGQEWFPVSGYQVMAGSAGRKQVFVSYSDLAITMVLPTVAKTVEEAEAELTDEGDRLLSRRQDANQVFITEE